MILKTENLSHRYGFSWAIRDINIEISENGIIGLLGSNGAGKSTTMNILSGTLKQTEGKVFINGIDLEKEPELAKSYIGFLPQNPPVYLDLTVEEFLTYAAQLRSIESKNIKNAVGLAMERTGISHYRTRLIKNLSGGYRQRVGISQAIVHNPKLIIMDEPTNGLDPNQLIEARKLIKEIAKDRAVLLSSHIMSEIKLLCTNLLMIESGKLIFSDKMDSFTRLLTPKSIIISFSNTVLFEDLREVDNVLSVEKIQDNAFRIFFSEGVNISQSLVQSSVKNGWNILELHFEKGTLEEIFKKLSMQS